MIQRSGYKGRYKHERLIEDDETFQKIQKDVLDVGQFKKINYGTYQPQKVPISKLSAPYQQVYASVIIVSFSYTCIEHNDFDQYIINTLSIAKSPSRQDCPRSAYNRKQL